MQLILTVLYESGGDETVAVQHLQAGSDLSRDKHINGFFMLGPPLRDAIIFVLCLLSNRFIISSDALRQLLRRDAK